MPSPAPDELLTSREVCKRLEIKPQTLYAYVARGLLRSERARDGGRGKRYSARELEGLVARRRQARDPQAAAAGALFWGMPVVVSSVSLAESTRLLYRGHDAIRLAERAHFEQVAALLWTGELPKATEEWPTVETADVAEAVRAGATLAANASPLEMIKLIVAALGPSDDARFDLSARGVTATARRMITRVVAAVAGVRGAARSSASERADRNLGARCGPMGARVLAALGAGRLPPDAARMADRALVLSAEHELNASTFAARVAASTGADPYATVCAAVSTLSGPKHGGATTRVETLVREARSMRLPATQSIARRAERALTERAARGETVPGFGHPLYPEGDPRVAPLLDAARGFAGAPRGRASLERRYDLEALLAIARAMAARGGPPATLDLALVATACALGLPPDSAGLLFAFGRMAGWIAHTLEQYAMDELIRPRARYVGPADLGQEPSPPPSGGATRSLPQSGATKKRKAK
jgi:citrate synthase